MQTAASAAAALEALKWCKPSVLVSELAMPCEDGYSLTGKLRAQKTTGVLHSDSEM